MIILPHQIASLDFWLVFIPGFSFGIFHTLIPCEDKTIFSFYALGVSRDTKEALKIFTVYSLGLMLTNVIIGAIIAYLGFIIGAASFIVDEYFFNGLGAIPILISGNYLLIQNLRRKHNPHSKQENEIAETFQQREGRFRKRTSFFLGILAGLPPCVFETYIYGQAFSFSASAGFINGVAVVFFFGIGSLIGLFPFIAFGVIGSYARKRLKMSSEKQSDKYQKNVSKLEIFSAIILITIGFVLLILALLRINVFFIPEIPIP